jgi:hypothetical protein
MIHNEGGRIMEVRVSVPADVNARPLTGDGWSLQLASGWEAGPGPRKGDYILKRRE